MMPTDDTIDLLRRRIDQLRQRYAEHLVQEREFAGIWADEIVSAVAECYGIKVCDLRRLQIIELALKRAAALVHPEIEA